MSSYQTVGFEFEVMEAGPGVGGRETVDCLGVEGVGVGMSRNGGCVCRIQT